MMLPPASALFPADPAGAAAQRDAPAVAAARPPGPRELVIHGVTASGRTFRPSDWAERLAGALASFRPRGVRPVGAGGIGAHIGYSPYCVPHTVDGVRCVVVSEALRDIEPKAWDFVMSFARDNELTVADARPLPAPPTAG